MNPLLLEIIRQCFRWLGVWLMTVGVPDSVIGLTESEDVVVGIAGLVSYALADTGWLVAKWRQWRGVK